MSRILILITVTLLLSCHRYQLSFNERSMYEPPNPYSDYKILDVALNSCVSQTIGDQYIVSADQLYSLDCSYGGIYDLSGLAHFNQLEILNLSNNNLRDIKPLMFLGRLDNVNLQGNDSLPWDDLEILRELISGELSPPETCLN